jgi:hypothetical protein
LIFFQASENSSQMFGVDANARQDFPLRAST